MTFPDRPPARGLDAAGVARFQRAQGEQLAALRAATADRPEHAEYLEALIEQGPGVEPWTGVSRAVADALDDDLSWCTQNVPVGQGFPSGFPGRYASLRLRHARAAGRRAATIEQDRTWGWTTLSGPDTAPEEDR